MQVFCPRPVFIIAGYPDPVCEGERDVRGWAGRRGEGLSRESLPMFSLGCALIFLNRPKSWSRAGSPVDTSSCPFRTDGRVPAMDSSRGPPPSAPEALLLLWKLVVLLRPAVDATHPELRTPAPQVAAAAILTLLLWANRNSGNLSGWPVRDSLKVPPIYYRKPIETRISLLPNQSQGRLLKSALDVKQEDRTGSRLSRSAWALVEELLLVFGPQVGTGLGHSWCGSACVPAE